MEEQPVTLLVGFAFAINVILFIAMALLMFVFAPTPDAPNWVIIWVQAIIVHMAILLLTFLGELIYISVKE